MALLPRQPLTLCRLRFVCHVNTCTHAHCARLADTYIRSAVTYHPSPYPVILMLANYRCSVAYFYCFCCRKF